MKKILILMGRYLPGYKDGGPVRTMINLTDSLGDEYDFHILTLDRDHGDTKPYDNIKYNEWLNVRKAKVRYVKPGKFSFSLIREVAKAFDVIYTCGFYDDYGYKTLILNAVKALNGKPVVVASMGSFSKGALSHKTFKKRLFIFLCKFFGLFKNIVWSVSSEIEANDLKNIIGDKAKYVVAEDLPRMNVPGITDTPKPSPFRIVFLSRICPQKNLLGAIEILNNLNFDVNFTICGPNEEEEYFNLCLNKLKRLPSNISWEYKGNVASQDVQKELSTHHVLLLPTLGENYCHVIFEALSVGCIPVISNTTPWTDLDECGCGYIATLDDQINFVRAINCISEMSDEEILKIRQCCVKYAADKMKDSLDNTGYRKIFDEIG